MGKVGRQGKRRKAGYWSSGRSSRNIWRYIIRRLLLLIPVLFGITFLSFAVIQLAGSDAVLQKADAAGLTLSQEVIEAQRAELGLDRPFLIQYLSWLGDFLRGDLGVSYVTGNDVFSTFVSRLPATLLLTGMAVLLTVAVSVPLGILAAVRQNRFTDYLIRVSSYWIPGSAWEVKKCERDKEQPYKSKADPVFCAGPPAPACGGICRTDQSL